MRAELRRARDPEGHRQADRVRQDECRSRRRAATGPPATASQRVAPPAYPEALSRAGIAPQPAGTTAKILLIWDKASQLSRAGFELKLARIFEEKAPILGQVGQESAVCHAPGG
jgi:hypothetical protein